MLRVSELAFPEYEYLEPEGRQILDLPLVPLRISSQLVLPETIVSLRNGTAPTCAMKMPKAPVHENRPPSSPIHNIRATGESRDV